METSVLTSVKGNVVRPLVPNFLHSYRLMHVTDDKRVGVEKSFSGNPEYLTHFAGFIIFQFLAGMNFRIPADSLVLFLPSYFSIRLRIFPRREEPAL